MLMTEQRGRVLTRSRCLPKVRFFNVHSFGGVPPKL
jgi:hypothetical protein